eukprot:scaffold173189_cov33-Tisochrysis_lutea.AAC.3
MSAPTLPVPQEYPVRALRQVWVLEVGLGHRWRSRWPVTQDIRLQRHQRRCYGRHPLPLRLV